MGNLIGGATSCLLPDPGQGQSQTLRKLCGVDDFKLCGVVLRNCEGIGHTTSPELNAGLGVFTALDFLLQTETYAGSMLAMSLLTYPPLRLEVRAASL
jgi:hypothetical protein